MKIAIGFVSLSLVAPEQLKKGEKKMWPVILGYALATLMAVFILFVYFKTKRQRVPKKYYERLGSLLGQIERTAIVVSLWHQTAHSLSTLQQDAEQRISSIEKKVSLGKNLKSHLKALEREGWIKRLSRDHYELTQRAREDLKGLIKE